MQSLSLYIVGAICAGLMGFAIQYGATCTVAAVDEIVSQRSANRLIALAEASLWVGSGLAIFNLISPTGFQSHGYLVSWITVLGGVLLGLGAYINKACVFGAIAKIGNGDWAYVFTPAGYFLACLAIARIAPLPAPTPATGGPPSLEAPTWAVVVASILVAARLVQLAVASLSPGRAGPEHRPHAATLMIGLTYLVLLVSAGPWSYMDILADLARQGMASNSAFRGMLFGMLLIGSVGGGWIAGRVKWQVPRPSAALRCLLGGAVMAVGSRLIPGQNDGLILVGLPLLWPYAWLAFFTMFTTIYAAQKTAARVN